MTDLDTESLELDRLAAELRVSQSPALGGWRNMGGSTTMENLDGRVQGMYSEEQEGVNLETIWDMENKSVVLGLRPREETVNMFGTSEEASRTPSTKKSCIYLVPIHTDDYNKVCFKLIGAGAVFCTAGNCTVAHRGGAVMTVKSGDIFVAMSSLEAFVEP
jgi:hypothetical protein